MSDFRKGDRIRAGSDLHGSFTDPVIPAGTEGRVAGERHDLFEHYVQVDFDNGAHAEIPSSDLHRDSGSIRRAEGGGIFD